MYEHTLQWIHSATLAFFQFGRLVISGTTKTMAYSEIKNCQTVNLPEGISLLIFNLSNLGYHSYEHFRVYRVYLLWISLEYSSVKIFKIFQKNLPKKIFQHLRGTVFHLSYLLKVPPICQNLSNSLDWLSRENLNRKPWIFPWRSWGGSCIFSLKPIHWAIDIPSKSSATRSEIWPFDPRLHVGDHVWGL